MSSRMAFTCSWGRFPPAAPSLSGSHSRWACACLSPLQMPSRANRRPVSLKWPHFHAARAFGLRILTLRNSLDFGIKLLANWGRNPFFHSFHRCRRAWQPEEKLKENEQSSEVPARKKITIPCFGGMRLESLNTANALLSIHIVELERLEGALHECISD
jgi:hypothetical protein